MKRISLLVTLVALLAPFAPLTPLPSASAAPVQAVCVANHVVSLSPGVSMTAGESDFATDPGTGTIDCQGTFDGQQITGSGTYAVVGRILTGPAGTASCPQGGGFGTQTFTIPTSGGPVTISEQFAFTWVGAAGRFEGEALSGGSSSPPCRATASAPR